MYNPDLYVRPTYSGELKQVPQVLLFFSAVPRGLPRSLKVPQGALQLGKVTEVSMRPQRPLYRPQRHSVRAQHDPQLILSSEIKLATCMTRPTQTAGTSVHGMGETLQ